MDTNIENLVPVTQDISHIRLSAPFGHNCGFTASISPPASFLTFDGVTISVITDNVDDVGEHNFTLVLTRDIY